MSFADQLKSVAKIIPGVSGYMSREEVRDTDKVVREHIASALDRVKAKIDDAKRLEVDAKRLGNLGALDRVTSRLDRLRNRVRHASYGHSAFFATFKVDETVLGQLLEFDRALGEGVAKLDEKAAALAKGLGDEAAVKAAAAALDADVQALDDAFSGRDAILGK